MWSLGTQEIHVTSQLAKWSLKISVSELTVPDPSIRTGSSSRSSGWVWGGGSGKKIYVAAFVSYHLFYDLFLHGPAGAWPH